MARTKIYNPITKQWDYADMCFGGKNYDEIIQQLENDKANYTYKVIATDKVSQTDAREVLSDLGTYDGKLIEFLTNGDLPSKAVATGRIFTDKSGNSYLITYNLDGTITQWNRDSYEKKLVESKNFTTKVVQLDDFTIDIQGEPPYFATVYKAFNKPQGTSDYGNVFVFAYNTEKQIQIYQDMESGKNYKRLITGQPNQHSFGVWEENGVSADIKNQIKENTDNIAELQNKIEGVHNTTTWGIVKNNITSGKKKNLYPIGKQFSDTHKKFTNVKWEVIDYDHIKAQDGLNKSNICLQTVNAYNGYQFDRPEFLYFVKEPEGLKAGVYNFFATKPYEESESRPCGGNKTYNFTLNKPIPQNGGIAMEWSYGQLISSGKIKTYKDSLCRSEDLIETVSIIEGESGTPLSVGEQTDGKGRLNQIDRIHFGSNNFAQSGVIQWLNGVGLDWWKKQTEWDTAPTYVTQEGFLGGFPQDFIDNLTPVTMTVATSTIYETNSLDGTVFKTNSSYNYTCKIFPLSMTEYGWGNNNNVAEGVAVDKYREASNVDKIKYDVGGTARYVWMRSPDPWYADYVRVVHVGGSLGGSYASSGCAVAPACIIQSK